LMSVVTTANIARQPSILLMLRDLPSVRCPLVLHQFLAWSCFIIHNTEGIGICWFRV
jgi:hypothetical protein